MRIRKNDVKLKIRESAKALFFENSYGEVSMRDVADKSDMTVGNIYRYYENKEVLFDDIVKDCYDKVYKLIKVSDLVQVFTKSKVGVKEKGVYKNTKFKKFLLENIIKLIVDNSAELYILINNSESSKYEGFADQITASIKQTIIKMVGIDNENAEIYSYLTITTLSYILEKYVGDREKLTKKMEEFFSKLFVTVK